MVIFAITGMCIGLLFDTFRIRRRVFGASNFITYIEDIVFWIITGIILIFVTMKYTDGTIRNYMMLGLIFGAILYFILISSYIIKLNTTILNKVIKFICFLFSPIKKIYKILKKGWKKKNNML